MTPQPERWRAKLLTRMTIAGVRWKVGAVIDAPADKLRAVAFWCRTGAAVPADEHTRLAVELFEACRRLPEALEQRAR